MLSQKQLRQCPIDCATSIDYSLTTNFPFTIVLDTENSILCPEEGQNQRFCYTITGVGSNSPELRDISHFLLGICPDITEDQIIADSISVAIDGEEEEVIFGEDGNVELRTTNNPDPTTGCIGLKFDFPVDKVEGAEGSVLYFCFELNTTYPVGDNTVCLTGGGETVNSLSICGPACGVTPPTCTVTAYQLATVCQPVTITPFATHGTVTTVCCGDAEINPGPTCPSGGEPSCSFTITQTLCVAVPISFGATPTFDPATVVCIESSLENLCATCEDDD